MWLSFFVQILLDELSDFCFDKGMSLKAYLLITVVFSLLFGFLFLIMPVEFNASSGVHLDPSGAVFARGLGGAILAVGIINWFARNEKRRSRLLEGIFWGNIVIHGFNAMTDFIQSVKGY
jgi:hypothetical protein